MTTTTTRPADLSAWLADIHEWSPDLFDDDGTPSATALSIAESCEAFRDMDAAANWASILTTAAQIAQNAFTAERTHGDVNACRAAVDSLMREYDRLPSPVARPVDPFTAGRHEYTTGRNKKGATTYRQNMSGRVVMRYGMPNVIGSCEASDTDDSRATMAEHLLSYVREHAAGGLNAYSVTAIANTCYGDLLDVCDVGLRDDGTVRQSHMIGTEVAVKLQVFDPSHTACREPIAEHNCFTPHDMRPSVQYEHADATGPDIGPRVPRVAYMPHAACTHYTDTRRRNTFRDRPLPRVQLRASERPRSLTYRTMCVVRSWDATGLGTTTDLGTTRRPMIAPADHGHLFDGEHAWFGYKVMTRGPLARSNSTRDRATAARRVTVARTLPDVTIGTREGFAELLDGVPVGGRDRWRVNSTFTLTVTRRTGRFYLSLNHSAPVGQVGKSVWRGGLQVRSRDTAARRLHAATTV